MKKILFIAVLAFAMLILPCCRWGYNPQTKAYGWLSDSIPYEYTQTCDGYGALNTVYDSEEEFLTWLESQEYFDGKYQRLFAADNVRFKPEKIPEGYELDYISVYRYMVTYIYKNVDDEVQIHFQYDLMYYFDIDEKNKSKTFEQTMHNYDEIKEKDKKKYYVKYPRIQNGDVLIGHIIWNINNYKCIIYTFGIENYDDNFFEYYEFEKVPLK